MFRKEKYNKESIFLIHCYAALQVSLFTSFYSEWLQKDQFSKGPISKGQIFKRSNYQKVELSKGRIIKMTNYQKVDLSKGLIIKRSNIQRSNYQKVHWYQIPRKDTLRDWLRSTTTRSQPQILEFFSQICLGVQYVHR